MTVEAPLQVRELERDLRDRWNEICIRQDVPAAFSADCQLLVAPFILHIFQKCVLTQAAC